MSQLPKTYRSDIDGLRAVAVLLVVLYHAGINIPGGFVGVDVFFVISGFLITGIVHREIQQGRFSFANFYTRRIKRLIPAFMVVAIGTIILIRWFYMPADYEDFAKSMQKALLGLSNFYFTDATQGYFASDAEQLPLIHTWSLSVEEQFYVVWPILMLVVFRFTSVVNPKIFLPALFLGLLVLSEWMVQAHPHAAYYLLPARAFELLLGGLLAVGLPILPRLSPLVAQIFSIAGLALIVISAFTLSRSSHFPGINALWPCLGAGLYIWAGSGADKDTPPLGNQVLSFRPFVLIGLISYSVYLWHWPPIALAHYLNAELTLGVSLGIVGFSLIAGWMTWKWVETPVRHIRWDFKKTFVVMYLVPVLLVVGFYKFLRETEGNPSRMHPDMRDLAEQFSDKNIPSRLYESCINDHYKGPDFDQSSLCYLGDKTATKPDFLLVGDSHANSASGFFEVMAKDAGITGLEIANRGVPFIIDSDLYVHGQLDPSYRKKIDSIKSFIDKFKGDIVLVHRWTEYFHKGANLNISYKEGLKRTFKYLSKRKSITYVYLTVPEIPASIDSKCLALQNLDLPLVNTGHSCDGIDKFIQGKEIEHFHKRHHEFNEYILSIISRYQNFIIIDPKDVICDYEKCNLFVENRYLYRDSDHLNQQGSMAVGHQYLKRFGNPLLEDRKNLRISDIWR